MAAMHSPQARARRQRPRTKDGLERAARRLLQLLAKLNQQDLLQRTAAARDDVGQQQSCTCTPAATASAAPSSARPPLPLQAPPRRLRAHLALPRDAPVAIKVGVALLQLRQLLGSTRRRRCRRQGWQRRRRRHTHWAAGSGAHPPICRCASTQHLPQAGAPRHWRCTGPPHRRLRGAAAAGAVAGAAGHAAGQRDEGPRAGAGGRRGAAPRRVALLVAAGATRVLGAVPLGRQRPAARAGARGR